MSGDYLSYGTITTPAATDVFLACVPPSAEVLQTTRKSLLQTLELGTTTLTGVGTLVLSGGTLTGSAGGSSSVGTATLALGGGSAGLPVGPIFGNVGTFSVPALSSFSTLSTGGGSGAAFTQSASNAPIIFTSPGTGTSGMALLEQSVSGTFTVSALVEPQAYGSSVPGIFLTDGTNYAILFNYEFGEKLYLQKYSSPTNYVGDAENTQCLKRGAIWLRLNVTATAINCYYSSNGIDWSAMFASVSFSTAGLTGAPTGFGFAVYAGGDTSGSMAHYLWHLVTTTP